MSRSRAFYHGTSEHWAQQIVNNGQRANMSPRGNYGRGFYLTPDFEEANSLASGRQDSPAVVEGTLHPDARIHTLTPDDSDRFFDAWHTAVPKQDGSFTRAANKWTAEFARQGYHVLRHPGTGYHVAIRPNVFLPEAVHYPEGSVPLR